MIRKLTIEEVTRSNEEGDNQANIFYLRVGDIDFGYLYLTADNYTLAWDGSLDFEYLDETARYYLYKQLDATKTIFSFSLERYTTEASLIVSGELKKFQFAHVKQPEEYRQVLADPNQISFARYDFKLESLPHTYSFTAENPACTPQKDREMAILLPRSLPLTKSTLRWVVGNHVSFRELKLAVDYHYTSALLDKLITGGMG